MVATLFARAVIMLRLVTASTLSRVDRSPHTQDICYHGKQPADRLLLDVLDVCSVYLWGISFGPLCVTTWCVSPHRPLREIFEPNPNPTLAVVLLSTSTGPVPTNDGEPQHHAQNLPGP